MKKNRFLSMILCFFIIFTITAFADPVENQGQGGPVVSAPSYILINMDNGEVLLSHNAEERKYPASTTKIMTAMLALNNLDLEANSTVSRNAVMSISWDSSKLGLYEGEVINNFELIKGMMVVSGNDAANVLAEAVSGSVDSFVELMNKTAKDLGCTGTHFANTHGLTDESHYTTVSDMAKIAKAAMENPLFREIVKTTYFELPITDKCDYVRSFNTTNNLITNARTSSYLYSPATGIKTGYTDAALNCLVGSAEKDGVRLISVILGASNIDGVNTMYPDTKALFEWGFNNYKSRTVIEKDKIADERAIKYAKGEKTIKLVAEKDYSAVLHKDADETLLTTKVSVNEKVTAPITKGSAVGTLEVYFDGEYLGEVNLVSDKDYEYSWWSAFFDTFGKIIGIFVLLVLLAIVVLIIIRQTEYNKRRKERRRNRG